MIHVTITLRPSWGSPECTLGVLEIVNDETSLHSDRGNYLVTLHEPGRQPQRVRLLGYDRNRGYLALVREAVGLLAKIS